MRALIAVAVGLVIAACDRTPIMVTRPTISATPAVLDFGAVEPLTSPTRQVVVRNPGAVSLELSGISIEGGTAGAFFLSTEPTGTLAAGASVTVVVAYRAAADERTDSARLRLDSDADETPTLFVALTASTLPRQKFAADSGMPDAGPLDAGPLDAGPLDAGPLDAGPPDAGPPDAGPPDAGPPDAGPPDAGPPDDGGALATLAFDTLYAWPVPSYPWGVVGGDFNGDGKADVLTFSTNQNDVMFSAGHGDGGFAATSSIFGLSTPTGAAVRDLNGDGKADAVVVSSGGSFAVFLGTVGAPVLAGSTAVGAGPKAIVLEDFNADGKPDAVTANDTAGTVSCAPGLGAGAFGAAMSSSAGTAGPLALAAADVNHAGGLDLIVAGANEVSVLLGNGAGGFTSLATYPAPEAAALAVGDYNLDGFSDFAVVTNDVTAQLRLYAGSASGAFTAGLQFPLSSTPNAKGVVIADFDSDGRPDIATLLPNAVQMLRNGTSGWVAMPSTPAGGNCYGLTSVDVDNDTHLDLVSAALDSKAFVPMLGLGNATFRQPYSRSSNGTLAAELALADFDGDGKVDVALTHRVSGNTVIFLGDGQGTFTAGPSLPGTQEVGPIAAADFDSDGKIDLALLDPNSNTVNVYRNTGNAFAAPVMVAVDVYPMWMTVGDFDGDGKPDLATNNLTGMSVSIALNRSAGSTIAFAPRVSTTVVGGGMLVAGRIDGDTKDDLVVSQYAGLMSKVETFLSNGNGTLRLGSSRASWGYPALALADFDRDGKLDTFSTEPVNDAFIYLGNGDGTWRTTAISVRTGTNIGKAIAFDVNRDGFVDVVVNDVQGNAFSVLVGNGAGGLSALPYSFLNGVQGGSGGGFSLGDFNADGRIDVVASSYFDNRFAVILNTSR